MQNHEMTVFGGKNIRRHWDEKQEKWYFSVVDIVGVLSGSADPRNYWKVLKSRLKQEGGEVVTKCNQLKMAASDGKFYLTDAADTETILRLVQSVPSPTAEPFKIWLARVGYERIQETTDPELAVNRARKHWQAMGRSPEWIQQRMLGQQTRNKLTDYWSDHGIEKPDEFARLTNIIHQEWSGISVKGRKQLKNLKTQNLRDHMSEAELIFTALAELSSRQISEAEQAEGYTPNESAAHKGGKLAGNARKALESQTGKKIVSDKNFLPPDKTKLS
ncbi:MAG TPA: BRO family protein [Patescibacteria group bacterium]|nr:BRO family protein [Patescibacteria group bacterium]